MTSGVKIMKIGILCYPTYGGSGVVATELGKKLARRGHRVHFITYEPPFRLRGSQEEILFHEVEVPDYPLFKYPPYSLALANKIVEVFSIDGLDLLHCHYAIPHSISAFLAREILGNRIRVITTLHGTDITLVGNNESFRQITSYALERSDGLTAVSESLAEDTVAFFDFSGEVEVIHNFIDTGEYKPLAEDEIECKYRTEGEYLLLHISNFRPVKNIPQVIRVFDGIQRELPARLMLVGDGPEKSRALKLSRQLGIEERVLFLGRQDNIIPLLSQADLFLLPSSKESFGLVALEALACEVPVIASSAGGLPEVIEDGQCGFLVKPGAVEEMIRLGIRLLGDSDLHQRMKKAGRKRAREKFDSELVVPRYEEYYARVLADDNNNSRGE